MWWCRVRFASRARGCGLSQEVRSFQEDEEVAHVTDEVCELYVGRQVTVVVMTRMVRGAALEPPVIGLRMDVCLNAGVWAGGLDVRLFGRLRR